MNQAERAGRELRAMDDLAAQDSFLHRLSPLSKLFVTIFYLAVVVSFPRYRLTALVWMALFPVAGYQLAGIALRTCFQKLRLVLPLVCAVGCSIRFLTGRSWRSSARLPSPAASSQC